MSSGATRRRGQNADTEAPFSPRGAFGSPFSRAPAFGDNDKVREKENAKGQKGDTFDSAFRSRVSVLVSLMLVQSLSGIILSRFEDLVKDHVVVTLFLTMLVGAGGNAGNQATVNVIRGLATGDITPVTQGQVLRRELQLGAALGGVLAGVAFVRVLLWRGDLVAAVAIGLAALVIVAISAVVGAALPLLFVRVGLDAAHAGPAIQVAMDIIGVSATCVICSSVFSYFA